MIREALLANTDKNIDTELQKEFDEMKKKYSVKKYGFEKLNGIPFSFVIYLLVSLLGIIIHL